MFIKTVGTRLALLALATLLILSSTGAAPAEDRDDDDRRACTPDVFRLCAQFIPDADRVTACLRQNVRLLSPACRAVFAGAPRRRRG